MIYWFEKHKADVESIEGSTATQWNFRSFCDFGDADITNKGRSIVAKFIHKSANNLLPNYIYDLYGIMDLSGVSTEADDNNRCTLQVLSFYEVTYPEMTHLWPEVSTLEQIVRGIDIMRQIFKSFFRDAVVTEYLLCHLISSTYARKDGYPICSMSMNLCNIENSSNVIHLLQLFCAKVNHILITNESLSEHLLQPRINDDCQLMQNSLQLTNGTNVVFDETKFSGEVPKDVNTILACKNLAAIKLLVSAQKVEYIYDYYELEFECDFNVLFLSKAPSLLIELPFIVPAPSNFSGDSEIIKKVNLTDNKILDLCRKAIFFCRNKVRTIGIRENCKSKITETFIRKRHHNRNTVVEELHWLLTLSKLLAALYGKNEVDIECWEKAQTMELYRIDLLKYL
ncbi:unnamed protein product [Dracunculus medinensis]|uniref:Mini-chromosome maintenance complex-binding protein n=1 Tax=Dracunculus medinensis TaxID=318479 RepID=A0A0N4UNP9_DRAME|nr:unnamed protein product [Dracunculus medinensis]